MTDDVHFNLVDEVWEEDISGLIKEYGDVDD